MGLGKLGGACRFRVSRRASISRLFPTNCISASQSVFSDIPPSEAAVALNCVQAGSFDAVD
jgi:hypothetical protein